MSETQTVEFVATEPAKFIVFVGIAVFDLTVPSRDGPDADVEAAVLTIRVDHPGQRVTERPIDGNSEFFAQLATQRLFRALIGTDVTADHVPNIRIPPPAGGAVTQQNLTRRHEHGSNNLMHDQQSTNPLAGATTGG